MTLTLASGSETRAKMLRDAGVVFDIQPSTVDEDTLKASCRSDGRSVAAMLAEAKAREVSARFPGRLVLGSDQVLVFEDEIFDKPRDRAEARAQIMRLRGAAHDLVSAAVFIRDGVLRNKCIGSARLTMRRFSDGFLDEYLDTVGEAVLWSVGGYQIEGYGAQLFETIDGDYFSILGLPLIPVLAALRDEGVIPV